MLAGFVPVIFLHKILEAKDDTETVSDAIKRITLEDALEMSADGTQKGAAAILGITPASFSRRLKLFGVRPSDAGEK